LTSQNLIGSQVRNDQDQSLGSVSEAIFEPNTNKIAYLVIARGGFLGIGRKHVLVPFAKFRITAALTTLVLKVSKEIIANAPEVTSRQLSTPTAFNDNKQQIDQYWDKQPA
jgi:ribosomal 30S subunit maturation factor RimM